MRELRFSKSYKIKQKGEFFMKRFLLLLFLTTLTVACSTSSTRKTPYVKELERRIKKLENKFGNKKERHPSSYYTKPKATLFNLGNLEHERGNTTAAKRLFKKACDGGDVGGCFNLGVLEDKQGNTTAAKRLFKKACDGGDVGGCFNLGVLEDKQGNTAAAKRLYEKACDGGDMSGCFNLGVSEKDRGNLTEARRLWQKACDWGHMNGCNALKIL